MATVIQSMPDRSTHCSGLGADELLELYRLNATDLDHIRAYGDIVLPRQDEFVDLFYSWLAQTPEYTRYFSDPDKLASVQSLQNDYWSNFFEARVDREYVESRRRVGQAHARIGLELQSFFSAMNIAQTIFMETLYDGSLEPADYARTVNAVGKLVHLDTSLVVESFSVMTSRRLSEQSRAMMEMSTPVTALWDDILMLPIVGIIDSRRAQDIMGAMLARIEETRSRVIILDISGVAVVDTAVANHLIKITKATRLMGCECTISGVSPAIAQTIVELGIDVGDVRTTATLRDALAEAFGMTGASFGGKRPGGAQSKR
jgi:rsbT co-antagonist protein RsbR